MNVDAHPEDEDRSESRARAAQEHKLRRNQHHVHDPGGLSPSRGSRTTKGDDDQVLGHIPTPVDLAKSFLHAKPNEGKEEFQAALRKSQYLDQSQMSSEDGDEAPSLGVGYNLSLPAFLADFLKGVADRVQVVVREVELDLNLKVNRTSESSSGGDASDRLEDVTLRLAVDSIHVGRVTSPEPPNMKVDSEKGPTSILQTDRRITLSSIEAMVISESSFFSNLARSTAPSSPEATHATSDLSRLQSEVSPAPFHDAIPKQDQSFHNLGSPFISRGSKDFSVFGNGHDRAEQAVMPPHMADKCRSNVPAESFNSGGDQMQEGREHTVEFESHPESALHRLDDGGMDTPQLPTEIHSQHSEWYNNGEETPPAIFSVFHAASIPEDFNESHQELGLRGQHAPSSHQDTKSEMDRVSGPSYSASNKSSPVSEDLAQSKIFTHEEASMYMSAISQNLVGSKDGESLVPASWDSSDPEVESAEGKALAKIGPTFLQEYGHDALSKSQKPESKSVPEHYDEPTNRNFEDHMAQLDTTHNAIPYESADDVPSETESITTPPRKEKSTSQGSESSSTNFRSTFTIIKRIIAIDTVAMVFPLSSSPPDTRDGFRNQHFRGTSQAMPGGFGEPSETSTASTSSIRSEDSWAPERRQNAEKYSIDVGHVQVLGDMGLTRLMVLICQRINSLLIPRDPSTKSETTANTNKNGEWRLSIKETSWKFLDAVKGRSVLNARHHPSTRDIESFSGDSEVLLRASMQNFQVVHSDEAPLTSNTVISIGKFSFGYSSDNILSFDSGLKMRESIRDALSPVGKDVVVNVVRNSSSLKIELRTLPMHIALDLRRLDETLGWFGGFSSMIGLGSSMMSTITVVDAKSRTSHPSKKSRGVHFESQGSSRPTLHGSTISHNKVSARIGGVVFDIHGTQSSLRFDSTAMKIVTRSEGLGLQVDRLKFSGPFSKQTPSDPSIIVEVTNIRVEYMPTPTQIDLTRLLDLLSPSKDRDARDDDILLERLLFQRKQGAVIRTSIGRLDGSVTRIHDLQCFPTLAEDLKKLSTVAKYLPEDDRAGMLVLGLIKDLRLVVTVNSSFGVASLACKNVEGAHVTFPSLSTLSIGKIHVCRNENEELLGGALPFEVEADSQLPTVVVRFIGNEMEPTAKIKFRDLRIEYHVSTAMAVMGYEESSITGSIIAEMANSVATITSCHTISMSPHKLSKQASASNDKSSSTSRMLRLDISFRDSIIGLNPRKSSAKGLFILTDTHFLGVMPRDGEANAVLDIRKGSIMVIDDVGNISPKLEKAVSHRSFNDQMSQVESLSDIGYVSVGTIAAAKATIKVIEIESDPHKAIDVDIRDDLFVLETCADSTQTLLNILNGLYPPIPPSTELRYRTEVVPIEDMLASFTGNVSAVTRSSLKVESPLELDEGDMMDDEVPRNFEFVSSFYNPEPDGVYNDIADSMLEDDLDSLASPSMVREIGDKNLLESFEDRTQVAPGNEPLDFQEGHFGSSSEFGGTAHRLDSEKNPNGLKGDKKLRSSPLRVRVRDAHVIWNLFDGYDWQHTRDTISQAVEAVQTKATERLSRKDKRQSFDPYEEDETVIGDFLFNSIYIGIPANRDPRELTRQVNHDLDDLVSESESYVTSTVSGPPSQQGQSQRPKPRKLRLKRSRYHKMTFELKGISVDAVVFPPNSGETQNSMDVRIQDLEIFDHVPTSTWKKFATYMRDAGERESGTSMIHLEISNVKPVPDLAAFEIVLKVSPWVNHS